MRTFVQKMNITNAKQLIDALKIYETWKVAVKEGYKNFLIYQNEKDFYLKIPEEVYSVYDYKGNFVGDYLESDFCDLLDNKLIVNTNNYQSQEYIEGGIEEYPKDIANYFVRKEEQEQVAEIKKRRTIIVILDEPKRKK